VRRLTHVELPEHGGPQQVADAAALEADVVVEGEDPLVRAEAEPGDEPVVQREALTRSRPGGDVGELRIDPVESPQGDPCAVRQLGADRVQVMGESQPVHADHHQRRQRRSGGPPPEHGQRWLESLEPRLHRHPEGTCEEPPQRRAREGILVLTSCLYGVHPAPTPQPQPRTPSRDPGWLRHR
jgi:hypothetical protein